MLAGSAALTADLGIAERRPLLLVSEDPVLLGVDIDEGQDVAAGQRGVRRASSARNSRCTFSSCRTFPQVNERRNDPSVDGARTPPNSNAIAPCRSTSMSSMLSAPATIPATRQPTFRSRRSPRPGGRS